MELFLIGYKAQVQRGDFDGLYLGNYTADFDRVFDVVLNVSRGKCSWNKINDSVYTLTNVGVDMDILIRREAGNPPSFIQCI